MVGGKKTTDTQIEERSRPQGAVIKITAVKVLVSLITWQGRTKPPPLSLSRTEIISRMHDNVLYLQNNITHAILDVRGATQKAETRISCNTIATWSSYLERNADIDNCLETGLGLGLGLGLGADASPLGTSARWGLLYTLHSFSESNGGGQDGTIHTPVIEKVQLNHECCCSFCVADVVRGPRDLLVLAPIVQLLVVPSLLMCCCCCCCWCGCFCCCCLLGGEGERDFAHPWAAVKIISRNPYYHAPKYCHAHDNERGGVTASTRRQVLRQQPLCCNNSRDTSVWCLKHMDMQNKN